MSFRCECEREFIGTAVQGCEAKAMLPRLMACRTADKCKLYRYNRFNRSSRFTRFVRVVERADFQLCESVLV